LHWSKEIWIALGGVIGTTVAALAAALYFWRQPCSDICWSDEGTTLQSGRLHKLLSVCRWPRDRSFLLIPPDCRTRHLAHSPASAPVIIPQAHYSGDLRDLFAHRAPSWQ
jgi:hypothetical protein